jgi:hypothetical protein
VVGERSVTLEDEPNIEDWVFIATELKVEHGSKVAEELNNSVVHDAGQV